MRGLGGEPKQWLAALALALIVIGLPLVLMTLGLIDEVKWSAWLAIVFLLVVLALKVAYAPVISEQFSYARQGNDLCLASLSGSIGVFALQLGVETDLLPGSRFLFADLNFLPPHTKVVQNLVAIVMVGLGSLATFVLTAHQIAEIRKNKTSGWAPVRAVFCYFLGMICVSAYIFLLVVK